MGDEKEKMPKSRRKSQILAVSNYRKTHYDRISFDVKKGVKSQWQDVAHQYGYEVFSEFLIKCIQKCIEENLVPLAESENDDTMVNN